VVSESQAKKNVVVLKQMVKLFVDVIVDNMDTIPEFTQYFIGTLTRNFVTTPPYYYMRFEVNRLNYSDKGGLMYHFFQSTETKTP
jgi:hypothetical protein